MKGVFLAVVWLTVFAAVFFGGHAIIDRFFRKK